MNAEEIFYSETERYVSRVYPYLPPGYEMALLLFQPGNPTEQPALSLTFQGPNPAARDDAIYQKIIEAIETLQTSDPRMSSGRTRSVVCVDTEATLDIEC